MAQCSYSTVKDGAVFIWCMWSGYLCTKWKIDAKLQVYRFYGRELWHLPQWQPAPKIHKHRTTFPTVCESTQSLSMPSYTWCEGSFCWGWGSGRLVCTIHVLGSTSGVPRRFHLHSNDPDNGLAPEKIDTGYKSQWQKINGLHGAACWSVHSGEALGPSLCHIASRLSMHPAIELESESYISELPAKWVVDCSNILEGTSQWEQIVQTLWGMSLPVAKLREQENAASYPFLRNNIHSDFKGGFPWQGSSEIVTVDLVHSLRFALYFLILWRDILLNLVRKYLPTLFFFLTSMYQFHSDILAVWSYTR